MSPEPLVLTIDQPELDAGTSTPVIDALCERIEQAQRFEVAIDISNVTFMDSTAISGFVRIQNLVDDHGGSLELVHAIPRVRVLFEVLGLSEFVRLAPEQ